MSNPPRDATSTGALLAVVRSELSGLVGFFQRHEGEMRQNKRAECTVETYRYLKQVLAGTITELDGLRVALGTGGSLDAVPFDVADIRAFVLNVAERVATIMTPWALNELPPGQPGEPEFEKAYALLVPIAKPYHTFLGMLERFRGLLDSPMYRLDVSDEVREAAWKDEKRRQIIAFIDECRAEIAQARTIIEKRNAVMKKAADDLKNIDQLPLFSTISDGAEADQSGPDSTAPNESGEQSSNQDGADAAGGT